MDNRKNKLQEIATANGHAVFGEEGLNLILEVFKLMTYGKDIEDTVTKVDDMLLGKKKDDKAQTEKQNSRNHRAVTLQPGKLKRKPLMNNCLSFQMKYLGWRNK